MFMCSRRIIQVHMILMILVSVRSPIDVGMLIDSVLIEIMLIQRMMIEIGLIEVVLLIDIVLICMNKTLCFRETTDLDHRLLNILGHIWAEISFSMRWVCICNFLGRYCRQLLICNNMGLGFSPHYVWLLFLRIFNDLSLIFKGLGICPLLSSISFQINPIRPIFLIALQH